MTWQRFDLLFRLRSPLHIGWRKSGNLQQSRGYVPGKAFWAGLTARLTRDYDDGADGKRYDAIGAQVTEGFRFSYLYPALQNGNSYKIYYPWEEEAQFDYLFLDSYASTALDYPSQAAAEGLLHETEFIAPCTRDGQPVYLSGALYAQTSLPTPLDRWPEVLDKLQFGGERGYGWGRVQLDTHPLVGTAITGEPMGEVVDGCITAHLKAENATTGVVGPIEPLIGWERNNPKDAKEREKTPAWKLTDNAIICYAPGATLTAPLVAQIQANGLWVCSPAS